VGGGTKEEKKKERGELNVVELMTIRGPCPGWRKGRSHCERKFEVEKASGAQSTWRGKYNKSVEKSVT